MQIADPAKRHQQDRDHVVGEHLPKVLALHIVKLGRRQRPVEGHRDHVVPPDVVRYRLVRVAVPALLDVPQPRFIPHHDAAKDEAVRVVDAPPGRFAELDQRRRFVLGTAPSPPVLDLSLRHVQLFR